MLSSWAAQRQRVSRAWSWGHSLLIPGLEERMEGTKAKSAGLLLPGIFPHDLPYTISATLVARECEKVVLTKPHQVVAWSGSRPWTLDWAPNPSSPWQDFRELPSNGRL